MISLDKLNDFKLFVKDKPYLANKVKDGTFSWQTLYETYDLFGKEHEFFKDDSKEEVTEESEEESKDSLGKLLKQLSKVDTKKISDGLENDKKIVGLIDEFRPNITSSSKLSSSRIKPFRKYND